MARNTKKKLAIFAGTSKCLIYAEAKYCASEMPGEIKYYECSRTEYCCAFGCCVSPGLHFHHLWYYWILVIIMFLVCSGGGWWYRYWLQGRYRAAASAIPTRSSNTRSQNSLRNTSCQAQQARITYNSARNTVLLHRMWKGPQRNTAVPAYNGNATTSMHYQNMNVALNDANCPYYQLYGPPPSYETAIAHSCGKISNPASPEASAARTSLQTGNMIPNHSANAQECFLYDCDYMPRMSRVKINHTDEDIDPPKPPSLFARRSLATARNMCVPLKCPNDTTASSRSNFGADYQNSPNRPPGYSTDRLSDVSDTENATHGYTAQNGEKYNMMTLDMNVATTSYKEQFPWTVMNDQSVLNVHGNVTTRAENRVSQSRKCTTAEAHTTSPKSKTDGSDENEKSVCTSSVVSAISRERNFPRERTNYGGSLRLPRRHTGSAICQDNSFRVVPLENLLSFEQRASNSIGETVRKTYSSKCEADVDAPSSSQSNPSNNVILETFIFENAPLPRENVEETRDPRAMNRSTNFDLESKHKLDRSKSLD